MTCWSAVMRYGLIGLSVLLLSARELMMIGVQAEYVKSSSSSASSHQLRNGGARNAERPAKTAASNGQEMASSAALIALERRYLASKQRKASASSSRQRLDHEGHGPIERHLILYSCNYATIKRLRNLLESAIDFASETTCLESEAQEKEHANRLLQLKQSHPETEVHVVAMLLQQSGCQEASECRSVNPGDAYLDALRGGVVGWFINGQPHFDELGVNRTNETNIQSTELIPNYAQGGRKIAAEFCRVAVSIAPARIAVLHGDRRDPFAEVRIDRFIQGLEQLCPEQKHDIAYSFDAHWSSEEAAAHMSPILLRDDALDAVIAASDTMALGALVAANNLRPNKPLLVSGFDALDFTIPLLKSGEMFATVDTLPASGMTYTLQVLLSDEVNGVVDFGPRSACSQNPGPTCSLEDYNSILTLAWEDLSKQIPESISTSVQLKTSNPSDQVLRERLELYNKDVRPPLERNAKLTGGELPPVQVKASLRDTLVYELYTEEASILAQGLLVLSWQDPRFPWSLDLYPDVKSIPVESTVTWKPTVVLSNLLKSGTREPLTDISTMLYPNGTVVWEQRINTGEFRCGSIDETVFKFPFDSHRCGIFISSYQVEEFILEANNNDFQVTVANDDWTQGPNYVTKDIGDSIQTVQFRVQMTRDPQFVSFSIIVPSFLLNVISFSQHWIPTRTDSINLDRGGMAITTILAALALRDTTQNEVGTSFTLLDLFLLVSLVFQFFGFLITAYESSAGAVAKNDANHLGIGDRLGKVIAPIVFGLFNLILSFFWGTGVWVLFYMSAALIMIIMLINRADRLRFRKAIKEHMQHHLVRLTSKRDLGAEKDGMVGGTPETEQAVEHKTPSTPISAETVVTGDLTPSSAAPEEKIHFVDSDEAQNKRPTGSSVMNWFGSS